MSKLTLGTAQITEENGVVVLRYMNIGNFTIGERTYGREADAREFCRERGLRVIAS